MKMLSLALVVMGSHFALADDYNVDRILASSQASRDAAQFVLNVDDVRDRQFTVQVASHLNEMKAIEHVKELKGRQETAFYYPNFIKNQVYFKVCVGRFTSKKEADAFAVEFIKRTNETFSSVISLLDRPGVDKKATTAQVVSADSMKRKVQSRSIASVSSKSINLLNEAEPVKVEGKKAKAAPAKTLAANMPAQTTEKAVSTDAPVSTAPVGEKAPAPVVETPASSAATAPVTTATPAVSATAPETAPEPSGKKTYSVQVAAYPYEEMAKVATAKVDAGGKDVFYKSAVVDGKTWYRLYVGKFDKYTDAEAFKKSLETSYDSPLVRKLYE